MQLIRHLHNLKNIQFNQGSVLAIGNFDGVHLGHQQILNRLRQKSLELQLPSVVMIFEPQPKEFFALQQNTPSPSPARLMSLRDKLCAFAKMGIDFVLCIRFDQQFASLPPQQFIQQLLIEKLNIRYLSVGDDFCFGHQRSGNFSVLKSASAQYGFILENSDSHRLGELRISSSAVRNALQNNDLKQAAALLGKPYSICGKVVHGNKLGRTIGFPTANIMLKRMVTPIQGVYAVQVQIEQQCFNGIANVGNRPTINGTKPLLEVHIFNFTQPIYGKVIEVDFLHKIRAEIKFASFPELQQQIQRDVVAAKDFFENVALAF